MLNDLETLRGVRAPASLVDNVLRECGLLDRFAPVESVLGRVYVAIGDRGIKAVAQAVDDDAFLAYYRERFGRKAERRDDLTPMLSRALAGTPDAATVDLSSCHPFQRAVLELTRTIRPGTVRPYAWIAREIGKPGAVRAVGTALANNPVPLVIPCHRVVRSDGTTGEYAFGAHQKAALLCGEDVDLAEVRRRSHERASVWSAVGEDSYCYPFCFVARPLPAAEVIKFPNAAEAAAHGLQPCETCHPSLAA